VWQLLGTLDLLRRAARTTYQAARRHPHLVAPDGHARFGGGPYADDKLEDDFYWAAIELWLTTDVEFYRQEVLSSAQHSAEAFDLAGFDFQ
jgi:endoglucanase